MPDHCLYPLELPSPCEDSSNLLPRIHPFLSPR
jgi:hypothetical protein